MDTQPGNGMAARLVFYVRRVENLDEQIAELREERKAEMRAAAASGFDTKALAQMVRERRMDAAERQDYTATLQVYRAALGMLDGTPLGDLARRKFFKDQPPPSESSDQGDIEDPDAKPAAPPQPPKAATQEDLDTARQEGREAAIAGKSIIDNPYGYGDARRAAYDEGWCEKADSDGMDIPKAFRRKGKPPKGNGANDDGADKKAA